MAKKKAPPAANTKRLPKDFDYQNVGPKDLDLSDPDGAEVLAAGGVIDREYPKHLHKASAPGQMHEYVHVENAAEEKAARANGFKSSAECDADNNAAAARAADAGAGEGAAKAPKRSRKKAGV